MSKKGKKGKRVETGDEGKLTLTLSPGAMQEFETFVQVIIEALSTPDAEPGSMVPPEYVVTFGLQVLRAARDVLVRQNGQEPPPVVTVESFDVPDLRVRVMRPLGDYPIGAMGGRIVVDG